MFFTATDGELLERISQGDSSAFQDFYKRYKKAVLGYAIRLMGDRMRGEDIAQEVWLKVVRFAHQFSGEKAKSWVMQIVRTTALNEFRKKEFALDDSGEQAEQVEDVQQESIEEILCRENDLKKLKIAIDGLPEQQRMVFVIWMTEGLSYDEICRQTGLSLDAVKSLIYRARQKLVKELRSDVSSGTGERGEA